MKYLDEFRSAAIVRQQLDTLRSLLTRSWTIMEICGGQTHALLRFGIDSLLPSQIEVVHGPGCPVCVTPAERIDQAIALSERPDVILCTYGDMLRVRGSQIDLQTAKARGSDVRLVYSPLDAIELAEREPGRQVVFFAVGFETTIPATALAVQRARKKQLANFSILAAHVRVPPAVESILGSPHCRVQGLLAAGHVCTVMGTTEYEPIAQTYHVPVVVTGFEPVDLLAGLLTCVRQLETGEAVVHNSYARSVRSEGNPVARALVEQVFVPCDLAWRGFPVIPQGGFELRPDWQDFNALARFPLPVMTAEPDTPCIAAQIMQGHKKPPQCPAFGTTCTPVSPLGAPMVSAEGACAAYYQYRQPPLEISPAGVARD